MTGNEIRAKFLNYFVLQNHTQVKSDSVVPKDDPTVLFTTAGMQQFKRQFLGHIDGYTRACSSQKCIRTDDLEDVGLTAFHHTFFEMLGNFSFGDYFKAEAIAWAWEFLTRELKLPAQQLWVSVYKDDEEAATIWKKTIGISEQKIFRLGDKSNFWPSNAKTAGPNGPCGPCSEIFYDYQPQRTTFPKDPDDEPGRFCEIWNLVFTQYNRKEGGILDPLPNKNIDTGMGLERLTAVMQGVQSNFETDLFAPILKAIDRHISIKNPGGSRDPRYVIADHLRAITMSIHDGVIPSNEGRGHVIKRLIISCFNLARHFGKLDTTRPVIHKLIPAAVESLSGCEPGLASSEKSITDYVRKIETGFISTMGQKMPEFEKRLERLKPETGKTYDTDEFSKKLGELIFEYYDTHGLPYETLLETTNIKIGVSDIDIKKAQCVFQSKMTEQQDRSRARSKMTGDVFTGTELDLSVPKTEFTGYQHAESTSTVLKMFVGHTATPEVKAGDDVKIILNKTPFYAESGGQIGDTGTIRCERRGCLIEIFDTQKRDDIIIHSGKVKEGTLGVDCLVKAAIDLKRRMAIMRNHTATHLLQAALNEILGSHVKQQGSLVAEDRLRFDFTHPKTITKEELRLIEKRVNQFIRECDSVEKEYLPIDEALKTGAKAFFAEKYGQTVRVISIGNYSKEFCGGTHLDSTGQIGAFKITSETAIAQGIRRIEARAGTGAIDHFNETEDLLENISQIFKTSGGELLNRIDQQQKRIRTLEKELECFRLQTAQNEIEQLLKASDSQAKTAMIIHAFENMDMGLLRRVVDIIKQKFLSYILVLGAKTPESGSILIAVSDDLIKRGINAHELIRDLAPIMEGSGGGRPQIAQAGSKFPQKIDNAMKQARNLINQKVTA